MASEAQRLINISLGKIATSRSQRGGLRLHKSLMVANIIVQARSQAMMETSASTAAKYQLTASSLPTESLEEEEKEIRAPRENSPVHQSFRTSSNFASEYDSDSDSSLDSDEEMSVDFELDFGKSTEENRPPSSPRKRRRSERQEEEEEEDDDPAIQKPAKKFIPSQELCSLEIRRNSSGSGRVVDCTNGLLDSLQMCHLTQEMSVGSGFVSHPSIFDDQDFHKLNRLCDDDADDDDFELAASGFNKAQPVYDGQTFAKLTSASDSYDVGIDEPDYNKDISLFQVDGLSDIISCSTQIREALETLTRPVISLTV